MKKALDILLIAIDKGEQLLKTEVNNKKRIKLKRAINDARRKLSI